MDLVAGLPLPAPAPSIGSPHSCCPVDPLREGLRGFQLMKKPGRQRDVLGRFYFLETQLILIK